MRGQVMVNHRNIFYLQIFAQIMAMIFIFCAVVVDTTRPSMCIPIALAFVCTGQLAFASYKSIHNLEERLAKIALRQCHLIVTW